MNSDDIVTERSKSNNNPTLLPSMNMETSSNHIHTIHTYIPPPHTGVYRISSCRAQKNMTFFILKNQKGFTLQAILFKKNDIPIESVVQVLGEFVVPRVEIKSQETDLKSHELHLTDITIVSESDLLPIQLSDLNHNNTVGFSLCLDNRVIDLRSKRNQAIFRLKSHLVQSLCKFLYNEDFIQIQTPKLTGAASEGGAEVFHTFYFDSPAYLVQSPQLYKQMCVNSDFHRVFEIGPVFRAENSMDSRHLCEFTGFDIEMTLQGEPYDTVVLPILWKLLYNTLTEIQLKHMALIVTANPEFIPVQIPEKIVILDYPEVVSLLNESGLEMGSLDDLKNEHEIRLGEIVKEKYNSDVVIVNKYPACLRPFYTMLDPNDEKYTHSYDILLRGQEILSGAQRNHNYNELVARAIAANINLENIDFYLESFKYGSFPHAGGGFGLERILSRFLQLSNIKSTSLFPRAPNRLKP
jgi:aspartyl/asparaginyl-tRNA synthetase